MKRSPAAGCLVAALWAWAASVSADLVYPASFEIVEEVPGHVRLSLTLPLIQGRVLRAQPVLPDSIRIEGDPEVRAGAGTLTRVWLGQADTHALPGSVIGLSGLLGTSREVRFVLSTLDGRRYEEVLRPTRAFFVVPPAAHLAALARESVREGLRRAVRHPGLWFLLTALVLAGGSWGSLGAVLASCVLALLGGHLLGGQVRGPNLPMTAAGLAAALVLIGVSARSEPKPMYRVPVWPWLLLGGATGLLAGWAGGLSVMQGGMSSVETRWAGGLLIGGWLLGGCAVAGVAALAWSLCPEGARRWVRQIAGLAAAIWAFYQGVGLISVYGPGWRVWVQRLWAGIAHEWLSPFAADWAMARLRIPWLTVLATVAAGWIAFRAAHRPRKMLAAGGVFCIAVFLLPWGTSRMPIPFMSPQAPVDAQARRILEPMLSGIYHAVNLEGEDEAYDRLAEHVTGDLLADLYVDSRRRLLAGTREGATVTVREVNVLEAGTPRNPTTGRDGYVYPARWAVTAKVTHWQHTHERRNLYEGDLTLVVEDDRWKIGGLDLHFEEREVVPGSFSSR